jgi:riboflavin kinase/FMN adenylyltransferase
LIFHKRSVSWSSYAALGGLRDRHRPCVATIGAFDGVHLGHRAVIAQTAEQAAALDLPTTVVTFEPLPREYLAGVNAPARLQSFRDKYRGVSGDLGVERMLCLRFNERLRNMSRGPILHGGFSCDGLGVKALVLGDDFRFGRAREGDAAFMRALGAREGFETHATRTVPRRRRACEQYAPARRRWRRRDFVLAARLLGRPYTLSGRVMHGRRLGRRTGRADGQYRPAPAQPCLSRGVFAVRVPATDSGAGLENAAAIANVGTPPTTVADGQRANLEVHILEGRSRICTVSASNVSSSPGSVTRCASNPWTH